MTVTAIKKIGLSHSREIVGENESLTKGYVQLFKDVV